MIKCTPGPIAKVRRSEMYAHCNLGEKKEAEEEEEEKMIEP
jgi:hypothetical protein